MTEKLLFIMDAGKIKMKNFEKKGFFQKKKKNILHSWFFPPKSMCIFVFEKKMCAKARMVLLRRSVKS
jgi:hypothetical protein